MAVRKRKSVVSMMVVTVVVVAVIASLGFLILKEYDATQYEYEVTGTHQYENSIGNIVEAAMEGEVYTTYMDALGETRVTTTSKISYHDDATDTDMPFNFQNRWSFSSGPDYGLISSSGIAYGTKYYGEQIVDVYTQTDDDSGESVIRWVGNEDGIVYHLERTIIKDGMTTTIIQDLKDHSATKVPFII